MTMLTDESRVLTRYRFTVNEYMKMAEVGIIAEDERVELIDGDVIEMSPIGNPREAGTAGALPPSSSIVY